MRTRNLIAAAGVGAAAFAGGTAMADHPRYTVTILEQVAGGDYAFPVPTAINEAGEIVGRYTPDGWNQRGFVWRPGEGSSALPSPEGLPYSIPVDINNAGVIVGQAAAELIEFETNGHAWKLGGGEFTLFPQYVSGRPNNMSAINDAGEVVGSANDGSFNSYLAVRFTEGATTPIFPGEYTTGADLNELGQLTGEEARGVYRWTPGDADKLILPRAADHLPYMWARGLNDEGHVVGITTGPQIETDYAFFYSEATGTILLPSVGRHNFPEGINNAGVVVGSSRDTGRGDFAWVWTLGDGLVPLAELLGPQSGNYAVWYCGDINEAGQIAAVGYDIAADKSVGMLLTPVRECPADFTGDGVVNTQDVLAFLNAWTAGEGSADFNGDGAVNTQDVLAFLNAWTAGCE